MNRAEQNISDILPLLNARTEFQIAFYMDQMKARLKGGKAAVLWDWNNTLIDNFWVRLNKIKELYERRTGYEMDIPDDIYTEAEASITLAVNKLFTYKGIKDLQYEVNAMMDNMEIENPIKDPRLPGIIQDLENAGIRSIGIASGSRQTQFNTIKRLLTRYYPDIGDIPLLLYPEWNDMFSHGISTPFPRNYEYTLLWKKNLVMKLQPMLAGLGFGNIPIYVIDNEPRQAELISSSSNPYVFGIPFVNAENFNQRIRQYIS
jgi:hypothetical protein